MAALSSEGSGGGRTVSVCSSHYGGLTLRSTPVFVSGVLQSQKGIEYSDVWQSRIDSHMLLLIASPIDLDQSM